MEWDEPFFEQVFDDAWSVIQAVCAHQKSLAVFREIAKQVKPPAGLGTEPKKFGKTRFGSRVLMGDRMLETKEIYEKLMVEVTFNDWLKKQKADVKDKVMMFCRDLPALLAFDSQWSYSFSVCCRARVRVRAHFFAKALCAVALCAHVRVNVSTFKACFVFLHVLTGVPVTAAVLYVGHECKGLCWCVLIQFSFRSSRQSRRSS